MELRDDRLKLQVDTRTSILQVLAGLAVLFGAAVAYGQLGVAREGQRIEHFTRAIDQLGRGELDVRVGGIYSLERIANNSPSYRATISEELVTFVRVHAPWPPRLPGQYVGGAALGEVPTLQERAPDVQVALTVLGRRKPPPDEDRHLDLHAADLQQLAFANLEAKVAGVDYAAQRSNPPPDEPWRLGLQAVDLRRASLIFADLQGAVLRSANLQGADLRGALLQKADLRDANLQWAVLRGTHLQRADLRGANLQGKVDLISANLQEAYLRDANLQEACLIRALLQEADLRGADLQGALLNRAFLQKADLQGADLRGAVFISAELQGTKFRDTDLRGANLAGVIRQEWPRYSLFNAWVDYETIWPQGSVIVL